MMRLEMRRYAADDLQIEAAHMSMMHLFKGILSQKQGGV